MRIIGGHDYFDSALAYGRDETLVLTRKPFDTAETRPFGEAALAPLLKDELRFAGTPGRFRNRDSTFATRDHVHSFKPQEIWFAGRRHGGMRVETYPASRGAFGIPSTVEWHWDLARFRSFLQEIGATLARGDEWTSPHCIVASNLEEHFERQPTAAETGWLVSERVSIAVWHHSTSGRNTDYWKRESGWKTDVDGLGKMGFARKLDPFAAFQELSMWVGGVLPRSPNPTVEIRDEKTMVAKHGMDEWSFRKPPERSR